MNDKNKYGFYSFICGLLSTLIIPFFIIILILSENLFIRDKSLIFFVFIVPILTVVLGISSFVLAIKQNRQKMTGLAFLGTILGIIGIVIFIVLYLAIFTGKPSGPPF